jgi:hypothetical protein
MTETTAAIFDHDRYVVLPALLNEPTLSQVYGYACKCAESHRMSPGDEQVPDTPCAYRDFIMEGLLISLLPEIERASGLALSPTYSYFRVYKYGDSLARHTDRPSCEISLSLCLGFEQGESWPFWIEGRGGAASINLAPGDAVLYRGMELPHWREKFEGRRQAQLFLHYVDQNGPCTEWRFDKKEATGELQPAVHSPKRNRHMPA